MDKPLAVLDLGPLSVAGHAPATQVCEDLFDHRLLQDRCEDLQLAAAVRDAVGKAILSLLIEGSFPA